MKRKTSKTDLTRRDFIKTTAGSVGATAVVGLSTQAAKADVPKWDRVADVVVVGSGASGLPAAIRARDRGASVMIVEANTDIGGHAMLSGGSVALGGGTSQQKKFGIVDSPDKVYLELTSRDGYMRWNPNSPVFRLAGASGISVADYQDVILVDVIGQRFYNELVSMRLQEVDGGRPVHDYFAAASSSAVVDGPNGTERIGGPVWAIFDADAVKREKWDPRPPFVDIENGYFFSVDTLVELAGKLTKNRYQKVPMPPTALQETVTRYNSFVDSGTDTDFGKPTPKYKIQTPPFYAAWATPILHDCYAGLRVNEKCQVIDVFGKVLPSFYCAGESAGGFTLHGLGRCIGTGYMAGTHAVSEPATN